MKNSVVMDKINYFYCTAFIPKEKRLMAMYESSIIRSVFGVKCDEIGAAVSEFERPILLSNDEIKDMFTERLNSLQDYKKRKLTDHIYHNERAVLYFIRGVRFFNPTLADELDKLKKSSGHEYPTYILQN